MHASPRPLPTACVRRRGERGVSIVLAMLVLFVLMVVIAELRFDASVELDQARAVADGARMRMVAHAAFLQARTSLLMDAEAAQGEVSGGTGTGEDGGGAGGAAAGGDPLGDLGGGSGDGGGDDAGGEGEEGGEGTGSDVSDVIARTDSRLDDWQDSVAIQPPVGNDYTLWVEVEDEDSKINLLGLWTADTTQREAWREIVRNLLDRAFEGSSLDLSWTDANEILDHLDDWVKGQRGNFDPVPKPPLKKSNADEKAEEDELDTAVIDVEEKNYPLTLPELLLIGGVQREHLHGFVEDDHYYPGLERYLTLWSHLELKPEPPVADEFADSPFTQGSLFDQPSPSTPSDEEGEDAGDDELVATPTNDGLVNVNTATLVVLRALAPDDIPTTFLERLDEFRARIDELRSEGKLDGSASLFDDQPAGTGDEDSEGGGGLFGSDDDDDPTKYVFETPDEVISKVEEEYDIEIGADPEVVNQFITKLSVNSQVFSIKVLVLDEATGRRVSYRSVVWRMLGGERPLALTLLPLEPYYDARRLVDFPEDIAEKSKERFERWTPEGYVEP